VDAEPFVQWWRADDDGIRGQLIRGGVSITLGATLTLLTALSDRLHLSSATKIGLGLLGSASLLFGLVTGFVLVPKLLFSDHYIGIRKKALFLSLSTGEEHLDWDEIERVFHRDEALVILGKDGEERIIARRFGGKTPRELADILDDARRKALHDLLGK
jgi:hypothetical protein